MRKFSFLPFIEPVFHDKLLNLCKIRVDRSSMRPDNNPERVLREKRLSRSAAPRWFFRCRDQQEVRFSYQQFHSTGSDNSGPVQMPVARGTVFQMDQATSAHQGILRHIRKRGEDTSVDRHLCLCLDCHHQKAIGAGAESLHNSTDFERDAFRKNAAFTGFFRCVANQQRGRI